MRRMFVMVALLKLMLLSGAVTGVQGSDVSQRQVFLIQNSGWMEPFFQDPQSPMIPLLGALGEQFAIGGQLVVASFNQEGHIVGRRSPHVLYQGPFVSGAVQNALRGLDLPRRADGRYADADFQGALIGAITELLEGRPGVIWMVTNNKNAPGNDPRVQENTRAYFQQLSESNAIGRLVAYPLRMPVRGRNYSENGLIIYGIGYGQQGAEMLEALSARIDESRLFADPAVVLKPLDEVPLRFQPTRTYPGHLRARMEGNALILQGLRGNTPETLLIEGRLVSEFYPHVIEAADLRVGWSRHSRGSAQSELVLAEVSPARLEGLAPMEEGAVVTIRLVTPPIARPAGLAGLREDRVDLVGWLRLDLDNVSLALGDSFVQKMEALYGLDQLPSLFFDNREIRSGEASVPLRMSAHFSVMPLILAIASIVFGVLLLAGVVLWFTMPRTATVQVGNSVRKVRLAPLRTQQLRDSATGERVEVSMGAAGRATVRNLGEPEP